MAAKLPGQKSPVGHLLPLAKVRSQATRRGAAIPSYEFTACAQRIPTRHEGCNLCESVPERSGAGRQDVGRLDLRHHAAWRVAYRGNRIPSRSAAQGLGAKLLAAPGREDQVRRSRDHMLRVGDDASAFAASSRCRPWD